MLAAQTVGRNMIFKHSHRFTSEAGCLTADDVLDSPLRICPHLTTSAASWGGSNNATFIYDTKEKQWYYPKPRWDNSPLLTHVIDTCFPKGRRYTENLGKRKFRKPYAREESQMVAERSPQDYWWCRSCSTKFRVTFDEDALAVTVYQNFGASEDGMKSYFRYLCRRELVNWEFGSLSRTFPDFACETEDIMEEQVATRGGKLRVTN
jgi:hypothetical protein